MKVEFYQDKKGEWRWRAKAQNGRIVADGAEGYASKRNAKRAWDSFSGNVWRIIASGHADKIKGK